MGNVRMRAEQINYGATNVKAAMDDLDPAALIALNNRMDKIDAWKATVKTEEKTGAEVTFTNALALAAVSLSAEIEAEQDLHGYDNPWVGGAGANIFGGLAFATALNNVSSDSTLDTTNKTVTYKRKKNAEDSGIILENVFKANTQYTFISSIAAISGRNNSLLIKYTDDTEYYLIDATATGTQVYVSDAGKTVKCLMLGWYNNDLCTLNYEQCGLFEGVLTAADFTPWENICPISGRTAKSVSTYGNNLSSKLAMSTDANGAISASVGKFYNAVEANKSYVLMFNLKTKMNSDAQANRKLSLYLNDNTLLYQWTDVNTIGAQKITITPTASGFLNLRAGNGAFVASTEIIDGIYLVDADYAHTVTIQLGQTVYGGTVNLVTGAATITKAIKTFNGGESEDWQMPLTWQVGVAYLEDALTDAVAVAGFATVADIKSNMGEAQTPERMASRNTIIYGVGQGSNYNLYVSLGEQNDTVAKLKAFLASNNLQICYELATPIELTLTPEQLTMLKGYNRLSSDGGGDITVEAYTGVYRRSVGR